jgi:tRNA(Ile)-lysidine synthase
MQVQWNAIINEIRTTGDAYLLAVSGGVDSIFMLEFMVKNSGKRLRVAHFNHGLRSQAVEEEALVRDVCAKHGLELHVGHGDPEAMRAATSLEAEARDQRYAFFSGVKSPDELLTMGHHANDQLETIVLRLMRGYPHNNLRIRRRDGDRYRPFLDVPKAAMISQARQRGYRWLEDDSNDDVRHERNWVRHVLIPEMMKRRNVLKSIVYSSRTDADDNDADPCDDNVMELYGQEPPTPSPR